MRIAIAVFAISRSGPAAAQVQNAGGGSDPIDARIRADMSRAGEEAAALFEEANQARASGDFQRALELYRKVAALAPSIDHPRRRACSMLIQLDQFHDAVVVCEEALALEPDSALDQSALAHALAVRRADGDLDRALELARRAATALPGETSVMYIWCETSLAAERVDEWRTCTTQLFARDPDGIEANHMMMLAAAFDGDLDRARHHLDKMRAAGMTGEQARQAEAMLDRVRAELESRGSPSAGFALAGRILLTMAIAIGVWLAGLVVLLAVGWILSRMTLRAAGRMAASGQAGGDGSQEERRLRRIYRAVVLLCGVYFYLSVPVLLVSVVVAGGGLIWLLVASGYIPIKLVAITAIIVLASVGAILRGLFVRGGQSELGYGIDFERNPRFRQLLDEVAAAIQTRPVDKAYLTPHTDMAVTERGGLWKSVRGNAGERCLIIGAGLLDGMKQIELRSVLAHEYGHFRNQDTAGGGFALAVRRSLVAMIIRLAQSGAATWYNPSWLFLRAYHRVYLVVSQGASRLQEVLADRWAVRAYGSEAFIRGFTHVIERSIRFDRHVQLTLREVIEHERPLANLYAHEPGEPKPAGADDPGEEELIRKQMEREPASHDSHPAPRQRLAWAAAMSVDRAPEPGDDLPVWDLFDERERLEQRMTSEVREAVAANHGVVIAA